MEPAIGKAHGVVYTPADLALFLAQHTLQYAPDTPSLRILDPACGEGELLQAVRSATTLPITLIGMDIDPTAVEHTRQRIPDDITTTTDLHTADFLYSDDHSSLLPSSIDIVITNPPYVRTQVLGAERSQILAQRYGLSGRVDLYGAFIVHIASLLRPGGVMGLLCSNRFLTTQSGIEVRKALLREFVLREIWDLGDTKLFPQAAVLPAIVIAQKKPCSQEETCSFTRIYERHRPVRKDHPQRPFISVVDALQSSFEGVATVDHTLYDIERGTLAPGDDDALFTLHHADHQWLDTIDAHTLCTFGDIASIRVGIKTTADKVFIRSDWNELPAEERPEPELLHPLLTHHVAQAWVGQPSEKTVLYPHEITDGRKHTIDLHPYPGAYAYLLQHQERLAGRSYVIKAGRSWYEIWVPHDPALWHKPKIVFPDISDQPKFFLDRSGAIVNGDCYWIPQGDHDDEMMSLLLAVANSSLATAFYDARCANKLYAGRRRYITQYVQMFPIPRITTEHRTDIHQRVQAIIAASEDASLQAQRIEWVQELDGEIWKAFGLQPHKPNKEEKSS